MREHVGLSLTEAMELHRVDKATIGNTESARYGVSSDRVRVWAANYSCADRKFVDALADMARERGTNWWDEYRGLVPAGLLDLAELEHHAVSLRIVQLTHMPGLLQHEDYVRAVIGEAVPELAPEDFDRKVEFRVRRSAVLDAEEPPSCTFLIHEAALRMLFGGVRVAKIQLAYLLEQSMRENVTVRILPFAAGGFPNVGNSTMYACGPVAQLDTVQSDTRHGSRFIHAETHLANYRKVLDRVEERCLDPERSREFIREVAQQL